MGSPLNLAERAQRVSRIVAVSQLLSPCLITSFTATVAHSSGSRTERPRRKWGKRNIYSGRPQCVRTWKRVGQRELDQRTHRDIAGRGPPLGTLDQRHSEPGPHRRQSGDATNGAEPYRDPSGRETAGPCVDVGEVHAPCAAGYQAPGESVAPESARRSAV